LANGSISFVRTRRISMVSSLAAAISEIALDAADHCLDCQHFPHLRHVALAHTRAAVGAASCLGNAARIRMRGDSYRNYRFAANQPIRGPYDAQRTRRMKPIALLTIFVHPKSVCHHLTWHAVDYRS
jgi:hypothetical protein